jgi:hypothetical protein
MIKTEEDTLRILRRPTYNDMREIWASSELYSDCCKLKFFSPHVEKKIDEFFKSYGWDVNVYSAYRDK